MNNTSKLNVVFVLPDFSAGGAERVMITLLNGLDKGLYRPAIVGILNKDTLLGLVNSDFEAKLLRSPNMAVGLLRLLKELKRLKPDIVISSIAPANFITLCAKPFLPNTAFIVREAIVPSFFDQKHPLLAWFIRGAYRILYPMADRVIAPSKKIIDEFKNNLVMDTGDYAVLYNPVDETILADSRPVSRETLGIRPGEKFFVASGRLHRQKGFDRLISLWTDKSLPSRLIILGEGNERNALQRQINEAGLTNVTLAGHVQNPLPYYQAADCFLLPSRWEGLPNVALESLACGTPVITMHEAGGIDEIAALAPPGAVRICGTMEEFGALINEASLKDSQASLLPDEFKIEVVRKRFSELLNVVSIKRGFYKPTDIPVQASE